MAFKELLKGAGTVILLAFCACSSSNSAPSINLPVNIKPEIKARVEKGWPKVLAACPGFRKYGGEMKFDRIEDNTYDSMPDELKRIDIVFQIPERTEKIPADYIAFGHTCYYGISKDGKSLRISKRPCVAVCIDKFIHTLDADFIVPLQ